MKTSRPYIAILLFFLLPLLFFGVYSFIDADPSVSEVEKRTLKTRPDFSSEAFFSGSYTREFDEFYSDTFPFRDLFITLNQSLNKFYYFTPQSSENDLMLVIPHSGDAIAEGGEALVPDVPSPSPGESLAPTPEPTPAPPDIDVPDDADFHSGSIIIVGDRAMEICYAKPEIMVNYSAAVSLYAERMPDSRVLSLITPNGGEFYSPEEFHTGPYSQKDMIEGAYAAMSPEVITVDAYSELRGRADEYLFFRTDHHWTQLGAYYAYVAFCKSAGFTPVPLSEFEFGVQEDFVGSMYGFTSNYPQSSVLKENPDTLYFYRPIREFSAVSFPTAEMTPGTGSSIFLIASKNSSSNKYLSFIGGDTPVVRIETDVGNGKSIVVVKESYGNAFVPFLVNHYETVFVVDPRKFYGNDTPNMNLVKFVSDYEIDDVLVIDYPLVVSNQHYINVLTNLIPKN